MVKPLRFFLHSFKWLVLLGLLVLIGLGLWLHSAERSLAFAKPWIVTAINDEDAPYVVSIGDASIDWTNVATLGKLHIKGITFAKRDGNVFAQFPEIYATIDPIGFLPRRSFLHKVVLREPRMFMARNAEGVMELGFEDSPSRMPLNDLLAFFATDSADTAESPVKPPRLPFRALVIEDATFTFTDEPTKTSIISTPFDFELKRQRGSYNAALQMPFKVDDESVMVGASLRALPKVREHVLMVQLKQAPARLVCLFGTCPEGVDAEGRLDGTIAAGISDADLAVHSFGINLTTRKAKLTGPEWFAEPLKLTDSSISLEGDWAKKVIRLKQAKLALEDTTITAKGEAHQAEDGWYVTGDGEASRLEVSKIYKYWPLFMAPDSRKWITGKLKSGYAAKGTLKVTFTPADFAAEYFPEKSIDAIADARDITFEYLPGFPLVKNMDGIAHFTATTVKVEGKSGSVLEGTKINHAVLWCPELNSENNPMEATVSLSAPASDAVTMLALKHFPFDDHLGLDAKTIKGTVDADMKLKFNAFSNKTSSNPDEIHLDAVDYDITAKMKDVAQDNVIGGYNARGITGTLTADMKGLAIDSLVTLGDGGANDIKLNQPSGKPLSLVVKGIASKDPKVASGLNDFSLTYKSGAVPDINVSGKRLDASVSYGGSENSLLADFPAMNLTIDLGELLLVKETPFREVKGNLNCTVVRCESAKFTAQVEKSNIVGGISKANGVRQFSLKGNNAGSFLKALDITDRMTGGTIELRGNYNDGMAPPEFNGRLYITEFTLKNSQILARILSVGSLTGIANMLTGSGIAFEKMAANISSRAGVITVDKGVANGASMGITIGGTVDTKTTKLNLKGVVAPAYALNSILGKIPLIGALAGGGEGLIAFNYWVKGTYDEPDVGVNPLSGLTPGFLRGIFSGFDAKDQQDNGESAIENTPGTARRR